MFFIGLKFEVKEAKGIEMNFRYFLKLDIPIIQFQKFYLFDLFTGVIID